MCITHHRRGHRRQALDRVAVQQGRGAQCEDGGPRIRDCRLSFRRHLPAAGTIAGPCRSQPLPAPAKASPKKKPPRLAGAVISGTSAGFGRRVAALLYDSLLLAALLMVFTSGAVFLNHRARSRAGTAGAWVYLYRAGLLGMIAGYYVLNWTRSGQTLGMRAWHLRAVTDFGQALGAGRPPRCASSSACSPGRRPRSACCGCTSTPNTWRCTTACRRPASCIS